MLPSFHFLDNAAQIPVVGNNHPRRVIVRITGDGIFLKIVLHICKIWLSNNWNKLFPANHNASF
jgi:hypothetical protein